MAQLTVVRDIVAVSQTAAEHICALLTGSNGIEGTQSIALAGGRTPRGLYECLSDPAHPWRARIDWTRIELFWSDERNVPPDDADSNFGMANRALIQRLRIPPQHVHRMRGEIPAVDAAREYDALLHERTARLDVLFDVMLLGIGADGHIASLFPGSPLLADIDLGEVGPSGSADSITTSGRELASGVFVPALREWRISLTASAVLNARSIVVLAAGAEKADAIAMAIQGASDVQRHPSHVLRGADDRVDWIIDEAAARQLS
jgi:6-phosphogluconolactonase